MFWAEVNALLQDYHFWIRVLVACSLWYAIACLMANSFLRNGEDVRRAARRGPWLSLILVVFLTFFGSWIWWNDLTLATLLTCITLLIPALIITTLSSLDASDM